MSLLLLRLGCAGAVVAVSTASGTPPPNFLVLFVDDMGMNQIDAGNPSVYGYTGDEHRIATPHIAQLAKEGMLFQHWYSSFHYCSPSRGSMLTGRLPVRLGIGIPPCDYARSAYPNTRMCNGVFTASAVGGLAASEITTGDVLRGIGYATGIVGKWHLGQREQYLPLQRGFDEYLGIPFSQDMGLSFWKGGWKGKETQPFMSAPLPLLSNDTVIEQPVDLSTLVAKYTQFAGGFISRNAKAQKPWYLYVPFNHIMASVASAGATADTLTFFTSDNGAPLGAKDSHATFSSDFSGNLPLRGGKAQTWEGGFREPGIVHWPGKIKAGTVSHAIASTLDIHVTILALTQQPLPKDGRAIDGLDLSPVIFGSGVSADGLVTDKDKGHACYFMYRAAAAANASGELFAVRCGTHKAHWATKGVDPPNGTSCVPANGPSGLGHIHKCDPPIVFDLVSDPGENHPLDSSSAQYKAAMQTIEAARATHLASIRPVVDENGKGSDPAFAICSAPHSNVTMPHLPRCTLTPAAWEPQGICQSQACRASDSSVPAKCTPPPPSSAGPDRGT